MKRKNADGNIDLSSYRTQRLDEDVADVEPAFEREHLEQGQHGVADVVKVEPARIGPEWKCHTKENGRVG